MRCIPVLYPHASEEKKGRSESEENLDPPQSKPVNSSCKSTRTMENNCVGIGYSGFRRRYRTFTAS